MSDLPDDDAVGGPIHPDDRLWRHPSELGLSGVGLPSAASPPPPPESGLVTTRRPQVAAVLLYSTAALLLMGGVWWASDQMNDRQPEEAVSLVSATTTSGVIATIAQLRPAGEGDPRVRSSRFGATTRWTWAGLEITWIGDDTPADVAGLLVGDVIVTVDGMTTATPDDLIEMVVHRDRYDTMHLRVVRNGSTITCDLTLDLDR